MRLNTTTSTRTCLAVAALLFGLSIAHAAEDTENILPANQPLEKITEQVTRDAQGNVARSVTTRETAMTMTQKVTETRTRAKDGTLNIVARNTERTDLSGNSFQVQEGLVKGQLVTTFVRTTIVSPDGGSVRTDQRRNKSGELVITQQYITGGNRALRFTEDKRPDASGSLHLISRTETTIQPDGTTVTLTKKPDGQGDMISVRRQTTSREAGGSYLVTVEVPDGGSDWRVISETTALQSHSSSTKIPTITSQNKINYGSQD